MSGWQAGAARGAYSALLRLIAPAYLGKLLWRGRVEPAYRHALRERFGFYGPAPVVPGALWLHAVSLGETRAAQALADALRVQYPGVRLLLTNGTATGFEAGKALLRDGDQHTWLPFDTPGACRRFLAHFRPAAGVLMETEIWPNVLHAARKAGVPMVLANARLSEKSARRGQRFSALLGPAVRSLHVALAQTHADAARLRQAGVPDVDVCGNLKFDMLIDPDLLQRGQVWRAQLGRPVMLGTSTREGEEPGLLQAWQALPARRRGLLLIVPRHPQRFDEVAAMVKAAGLRLARRSSWTTIPTDEALAADVWLGDSMREMPMYYGLADVALLGGSFAPLGGQNLIEAAACGCPVVMGPHTFNFAEAAELSLAAGAALRVAGIDEGVARAADLLVAGQRDTFAANALAFAAAHQGAARRMAGRIVPLLKPA
ncbi:3-deoxy-D-manno-octulosonic acid transferase [Rhizobacter sp. Root1221]|nr:3-deoxy-D-manno-octulosonic acid transferase [Rhizobacter sp. Root1221]KQW00487.1 3-deoxy-D-manno-octulosonic acid transferase [Rhizobacter sp. Root1221]